MARKKKNVIKKFVIAIKDYDVTKVGIENGTIKMPYENSEYLVFFNSDFLSVSEMSGLRKFIKKVGLKKADVQHHWSGLIDQNFTLTEILFSGTDDEFRKLCDEKYIKYLLGVK
jgi:hypothetical protein